MNDPDASEAGRLLNRARWGPPGSRELTRAAALLVQKADELSPTLRAVVMASLEQAEQDPP